MKKWLLIMFGSLFFSTAQAQIPTTDVAHIATSVFNAVETMGQWASQYGQMVEQIQQYQQQITQMKQQYNSITGARGMGNLLSSSNVMSNYLPDDWQNVLSNVKNSSGYKLARSKYPSYSGRPKANALYDVVASHDSSTSDMYNRASTQMSDIRSLMGQIEGASDPAAKQDLMNRLVSQQNALQGTQNLVTLLHTKQKQELEQASSEAAKEHACGEFKRSGC